MHCGTRLDDPLILMDNELTLFIYCLESLDRSIHDGEVLLYIMSCNITFRGPKRLELLGIALCNGNSDSFHLCTLQSTIQLVLQQLFIFFFFLQTVNPSLYSNLHGLIGDYSVTFVR